MRNDLGLDGVHVEALVRRAQDLPWVEFAHTPQLPHLGIARLFLVAQREAQRRDGVFVYCVNDHLSASLLPESRYLPFHSGRAWVAKPPHLGLSKPQAKGAMFMLPPPSANQLAAFCDRWVDVDRKRADQIRRVCDFFEHCATQTKSLASWATRITLEALGITALVLPTSRMAQALTDAYSVLANRGREHGWSLCPACGYRLGVWETRVSACSICHTRIHSTLFAPTVIGRQAAANLLQFDLRVSGGERSYQDIADSVTSSLVGAESPPRLRVTGACLLLRSDGNVDRMNLFQALTLINGCLPPPPEDPSSPWTLAESPK